MQQFIIEYSIKGAHTASYNNIERDYQQFTASEMKLGKIPKVTNLPTILNMIKSYIDKTG